MKSHIIYLLIYLFNSWWKYFSQNIKKSVWKFYFLWIYHMYISRFSEKVRLFSELKNPALIEKYFIF